MDIAQKKVRQLSEARTRRKARALEQREIGFLRGWVAGARNCYTPGDLRRVTLLQDGTTRGELTLVEARRLHKYLGQAIEWAKKIKRCKGV